MSGTMAWDLWVFFGILGQLMFGGRMLVQWIASEKKKESHIPIAYWYLSIGGAAILLIYAIHLKDPVFILGQSFGFIVYLRNLMLISAQKEQGALEKKTVKPER